MAWVLALSLPLGALAGAVLLAGQAGATGQAVVQAEEIGRLAPEVVVLGASVASEDVDLVVLARELGRSPDRLVTVAANNAALPVWYMALRNRVFGGGARPEVVVVVGTLGQILQAGLPAQHDRASFASELRGDETADELVAVRGHPGVLSLQAHAGGLVDELTHALRGLAIGLVRGGEASQVQERISASWEVLSPPSLDELRVTDPLAVRRYERFLTRFERRSPAEDTLLGPLVHLAAEHGAAVVVVRAPVAPGAPFDHGDLSALSARTGAFVEAAGGHYVDLSRVALPEPAFRDPLHMTPLAAERFAEEVAAALQGLGVLRVHPE